MFSRIINAVEALFEMLVWISNAIGMLLLFGMSFLVAYDVLLRNLINQPIPGVANVVSMSVVILAFLFMPGALSGKRFTRSEGALKHIGSKHPAREARLRKFHCITGALMFFTVALGAWPLFKKSWSSSEFSGSIGYAEIPVWPMRLVVVVESLLVSLYFIVQLTNTRKPET